jgi:hypothetical protein
LGLLPDIMSAPAMTEPEDLLDALEESIRAEQHTRVRKLGPVIVSVSPR